MTEQQNDRSRKAPRPSRPHIPGYGIPETIKGTLPWEYVSERMQQAVNYWIATVDTEGKPHATPVWGVWVRGRLFFDGSPQTQRGRNIAQNPAVVVHLESGSEVVILHGEAAETLPDADLAQELAREYSRKYKSLGYEPAADSWDAGSLIQVDFHKGFAWTKFPQDATRWEI